MACVDALLIGGDASCVDDATNHIKHFYACVCCALDDEFVIDGVGVDEDVGGVEVGDAFADLHAGLGAIGLGAGDAAVGYYANAIAHVEAIAAVYACGGSVDVVSVFLPFKAEA